MTAGELLLVVGAVLCALAFAASAVMLVRTREALGVLQDELAALRTETGPLLEELRASADGARLAVSQARAELDRLDGFDRFDRVVGSGQAIAATSPRSSRVARSTLSTPMIKAAGLATGTSRAVRRLRSGA